MSDLWAVATPETRQLYERLLGQVNTFGPFQEELKKTSIHLARVTAFAGVRPRRQYLLLTIKADKQIESPRIAKAEQASKNRWHLELKLARPEELDAELIGWLRKAYELAAGREVRIEERCAGVPPDYRPG